MPATMKPFRTARPARPTVRVTARKYARASSVPMQRAFRVEPHDRVRSFVAAMSSEGNSPELFDVAAGFIETLEDLNGLPIPPDELPRVLDRIREVLGKRGNTQVARPLPVQRLRPPEPLEHHGYPLRRTQRVIFNREKGRVTAELKEVSGLLDLRGFGTDEDAALRDMERQFDQLVREKVRIPPHARQPEDDHVRLVINHLIDWELFARENPTPHLLWGRIVGQGTSPRPVVHWLVGPDGLRKQTRVLPRRLTSPYFLPLRDGDWFRAVVLEYPDRVEWVEPPASCPDPTDPAARKAAWEAIPRIVADQPDVWPLKWN